MSSEDGRQTELESRTDALVGDDTLSGYASIDVGLKAITKQLKHIVIAGLVSVVILASLGALYVANLSAARRAGVLSACDAIERLAVANERFIRDATVPGAVTDERLTIYHLYIDPAIDECRQEASLQAVPSVPQALRP